MHIDQIRCHFWANGFTGCEEKIGYIYFAFIVFLGNDFSILIGKRKISNRVVFADVLHRRIHQFWIDIRWIVYWQRFLGFQRSIKKENRNDGKHQQCAKEFTIFIEKGFHKKKFVAKVQKREF